MVAMRDSSGTALGVGRFAGLEPLGFEAGDNNWYRFVANGPTGKADPSGLEGMALAGGPVITTSGRTPGVITHTTANGTVTVVRPTSSNNPASAAFHDLADALAGLLGPSPTPDQLNEATRIAKRIASTFENNSACNLPAWYWRFKSGCGNLVKRWTGGDDRVRGYKCFDWAYAFRNAVLAESPSVFSVEVQWATGPTRKSGDPLVHYWIAIRGPNGVAYVDDGFMNGNFVHNKPPIGDYTLQPPGSLEGLEKEEWCTYIPVR